MHELTPPVADQFNSVFDSSCHIYLFFLDVQDLAPEFILIERFLYTFVEVSDVFVGLVRTGVAGKSPPATFHWLACTDTRSRGRSRRWQWLICSDGRAVTRSRGRATKTFRISSLLFKTTPGMAWTIDPARGGRRESFPPASLEQVVFERKTIRRRAP
jgi:hypothetical protein